MLPVPDTTDAQRKQWGDHIARVGRGVKFEFPPELKRGDQLVEVCDIERLSRMVVVKPLQTKGKAGVYGMQETNREGYALPGSIVNRKVMKIQNLENTLLELTATKLFANIPHRVVDYQRPWAEKLVLIENGRTIESSETAEEMISVAVEWDKGNWRGLCMDWHTPLAELVPPSIKEEKVLLLLKIGRDLVRIMQDLEEQKIIHRDLKLGNLLWEEEKERVSLCDIATAVRYDPQAPLGTHHEGVTTINATSLCSLSLLLEEALDNVSDAYSEGELRSIRKFLGQFSVEGFTPVDDWKSIYQTIIHLIASWHHYDGCPLDDDFTGIDYTPHVALYQSLVEFKIPENLNSEHRKDFCKDFIVTFWKDLQRIEDDFDDLALEDNCTSALRNAFPHLDQRILDMEGEDPRTEDSATAEELLKWLNSEIGDEGFPDSDEDSHMEDMFLPETTSKVPTSMNYFGSGPPRSGLGSKYRGSPGMRRSTPGRGTTTKPKSTTSEEVFSSAFSSPALTNEGMRVGFTYGGQTAGAGSVGGRAFYGSAASYSESSNGETETEDGDEHLHLKTPSWGASPVRSQSGRSGLEETQVKPGESPTTAASTSRSGSQVGFSTPGGAPSSSAMMNVQSYGNAVLGPYGGGSGSGSGSGGLAGSQHAASGYGTFSGVGVGAGGFSNSSSVDGTPEASPRQIARLPHSLVTPKFKLSKLPFNSPPEPMPEHVAHCRMQKVENKLKIIIPEIIGSKMVGVRTKHPMTVYWHCPCSFITPYDPKAIYIVPHFQKPRSPFYCPLLAQMGLAEQPEMLFDREKIINTLEYQDKENVRPIRLADLTVKEFEEWHV